jgi:NurA-like 5'-3' nuclease
VEKERVKQALINYQA